MLLWASLNRSPIDGNGPIRQFVALVLNVTQAHRQFAWLDYNVLEALANVCLYVPLGVSIVLFARRWHWLKQVLLGVAVTCSAELAQKLFLPQRFATIDDVLHNSLGVVIGVVSARCMLALLSKSPSQG